MTRYFIKINSAENSYQYACFKKAYSDDQKVGNLIYRHQNDSITKKESKLLEKIKIDIFVTKGASLDDVVDFFYGKNGSNKKMIIEVNKMYVKKANYKIVRYRGGNMSDPGKIYLPTFYNELNKCKTDKFFHIFISGDDYAYLKFESKYEGDDLHKIICYEQFDFDKQIDHPDFFDAYKEFLDDNYIHVTVDDSSTTIIDCYEYDYDKGKHENYVTASFYEIFDYVNKNLPTPKTYD